MTIKGFVLEKLNFKYETLPTHKAKIVFSMKKNKTSNNLE